MTLLDIEDHRACLVDEELILYDEKQVPAVLRTKGIDIVLLLTVLHHSTNPGMTLRHVAELCPKRVLVIESVPELDHPALGDIEDQGLVERLRYEYCGFIDWVYNRVICQDVQVTFNYLPVGGWVQMFGAAGFRLLSRRDLGLDQSIVPEWHVLLDFCSITHVHRKL